MTTAAKGTQAPADVPAATETITGDVKTPPAPDAAADAAAAAAKATTDAAATAAAAAAAEAETKRKADDAAEAAKPKAPEKYDLAVPKGSEEWLDPTDIAAVEKIARDNDFTNEQAQALLDGEADRMATQSATFRAQVVADATYGGDHLKDTQTHARLFLDTLRPEGTPEGDSLRRMLARTGYGNHLAVVSLFADVGRLMADDKPISARGATTPTKRDAASVLYGTTDPEKK